jgi:tetratricopeptide (TPR) repeat protein
MKEKRSRAREPPAFNRRVAEQSLNDVVALMANHQFSSIEEANAFIQDKLAHGGIPRAQANTPLEKAQELMYEAEVANPKRRLELAKKALALTPDCAEAYIILAENAANRDLPAAVEYAREGVLAGERALGKEPFSEDVGHFWGILSTRPYMRARAALAEFLWWNHNYHESIDLSWETLRLNPGDNQGIRYVLAQRLLAVNQDDAFAELLAKNEDDGMATFAYSRALWLFRKEGASPAADAALSEAVKCNPYVPGYLIQIQKIPSHLPDHYGIGDRNEAIFYVTGAIEAWARSKGALLWLRSRCGRRVHR